MSKRQWHKRNKSHANFLKLVGHPALLFHSEAIHRKCDRRDRTRLIYQIDLDTLWKGGGGGGRRECSEGGGEEFPLGGRVDYSGTNQEMITVFKASHTVRHLITLVHM